MIYIKYTKDLNEFSQFIIDNEELEQDGLVHNITDYDSEPGEFNPHCLDIVAYEDTRNGSEKVMFLMDEDYQEEKTIIL